MTGPGRSEEVAPLRAIKLAHTVVWAIFAGCIVALPVFAWMRRLDVAFALIVIVGLEVLVLVANRMRCPLTSVAARYTEDRAENFDIYLPRWVARYNKEIFGSMFFAGVVYTLLQWRWA